MSTYFKSKNRGTPVWEIESFPVRMGVHQGGVTPTKPPHKNKFAYIDADSLDLYHARQIHRK